MFFIDKVYDNTENSIFQVFYFKHAILSQNSVLLNSIIIAIILTGVIL